MRSGPGGFDGRGAIAAVASGVETTENLHTEAVRRISQWEPGLGAVVETVPYRPPADGPLKGMMLGIKTHIDVAGHRNWTGLQGRGMQAAPVDEDATVVTRLRSAGSTLVCTTSSPFIGAPGGVTPQTRNPRSPDRVSGGSSGGSAAAIAAGVVHAALGSDAGGSIRIPAACCGVVGLQTTRGLVPLTRAGGLTYSMGNVGPMAATVADTRLVLAAIAGFDEADPYSVAVDRYDEWGGGPLRIGIPEELVGRNVDQEVREAFEQVAASLSSAGHDVRRLSIPILREAMDLGPRTIGIVESGSIIEDTLLEVLGDRPELIDAVRRASEFSGPTLARTYHRVAVLRAELRRVFAEYDLLLTPTLPCRVPDSNNPYDEAEIEVGGGFETRTSALTRLVNPWNLAALPAGSQPVARDSGGAPISIQFIGPPFSEWKILGVMAWVEASLGGPWDTVVAPS
jgi:aspartyl-tRNA(Asn)/glutamyl-tRNA(Gln) amidotransferase subunit A